MSHVEISHFDTEVFPFRALVEELFGVTGLEDLHLAFPEQAAVTQLPDWNTDEQTHFHKVFYGRCAAGWPQFQHTYESFVREIGQRYFLGAPFVYQHSASFRVQLPGSVAVGEFHRDRDYNHPPGEINFIMALTPSIESSAMWIESEPDWADYRPVNLQYGEVARFDGNACRHGNYINATGKTRVSIDFRLLSMKDLLRSEPRRSVGLGLPFTIGGYYRLAEAAARPAHR